MNFLKETIEFICAVLYLIYLNLSNKKPRRIVIYYHSVKKEAVQRFQKQMKYLANECTVVKPQNIKTAQANGTNHVVAITFDDAFVSVMENAVPILEMYNLPAGVFVPAGNLGKPPRWEILENCSDKDETVISKEWIAKLVNDGFEVFSHTVSHPLLTEIDDDRLRYELIESKKELERIIGNEVLGISYPHGALDAKVCKAAAQAGYRFGFTIEPHIVDDTTDDLQIGRFSVLPNDSLIKFKLKISGAYQVAGCSRAIKRMILRRWN